MSEKKNDKKEEKDDGKYNFEDWLKKRLPKPSEDPDMFRRTDEFGGKKHIDSLVHNGKMKMEERDKINQAKQEAFFKSVEINSSLLFHCHKQRAENSKDKEQYLHSIIAEVDDVIDSKKLRKINAGDTDIAGIYAKDYINLKEKVVQNHEWSNQILNNDINWNDDTYLIYFNEFQKYTYMHKTKLLLEDSFHSILFSNTRTNASSEDAEQEAYEPHNIKNFNIRTARGRIGYIESIYHYKNRTQPYTWEQALEEANKQAEFPFFKHVDSFYASRNSLIKRERNEKLKDDK